MSANDVIGKLTSVTDRFSSAASPYHPDVRRLATVLPRSAFGPRTFRVVRWLMSRAPRSAAGVETVPVGSCSVRLHGARSGGGPRPGLLWIHGGGYVIGNAWQDDPICAAVAQRLGAVVAAVDYRLAPEHPFPIPLEDCHDALVWLAQRADVDERRIAIGGASAGGGLAAALALLARERGKVAPVFQLLSYPMLDDRTVLRADVDERHLRLWSPKANRFGWSSYLGVPAGSAGVDPLAAPARCEDLAGLPPAWIGVGSLDLFIEEDTDYAARLEAAGVACQLDVVEGTFHGFDSVRPRADVSKAYRDAQLRALAGAFGVDVPQPAC